jgi:hypothetical protein
MNKNKNSNKELVNFFMGLLAVTDLQLDFLNELEGTAVYRQKMKHHGQGLKAECEKYYSQFASEVQNDKEAEQQMYAVTEIFNQFLIAIRKFDPEKEKELSLLGLLKCYNEGEGIRIENDL